MYYKVIHTGEYYYALVYDSDQWPVYATDEYTLRSNAVADARRWLESNRPGSKIREVMK